MGGQCPRRTAEHPDSNGESSNEQDQVIIHLHIQEKTLGAPGSTAGCGNGSWNTFFVKKLAEAIGLH